MNAQMDAIMGDVFNMTNKKGMSTWIWVLIIIILIAVGAGVYLWITGGDINSIIGGGSSISQPPALPSG